MRWICQICHFKNRWTAFVGHKLSMVRKKLQKVPVGGSASWEKCQLGDKNLNFLNKFKLKNSVHLLHLLDKNEYGNPAG